MSTIACFRDPDARSRLNSNVSDVDVDLNENPSYIKTVTLLNEFYGQGMCVSLSKNSYVTSSYVTMAPTTTNK